MRRPDKMGKTAAAWVPDSAAHVLATPSALDLARQAVAKLSAEERALLRREMDKE